MTHRAHLARRAQADDPQGLTGADQGGRRAVRAGATVAGALGPLEGEDPGSTDPRQVRRGLHQSYSRRHGFSTTKNDKPRDVPLTWDACEALRVQRSRVEGPLVFENDDGEVLDDQVTGRVIKEICEAIGIRHIRNHVLRHTFASHAVMRGVPVRQVQEWLGHSNIMMTMRYAHLAPAVGDDLIKRLAPAPEDGAARPQRMSSTRELSPSGSPLNPL